MIDLNYIRGFFPHAIAQNFGIVVKSKGTRFLRCNVLDAADEAVIRISYGKVWDSFARGTKVGIESQTKRNRPYREEA